VVLKLGDVSFGGRIMGRGGTLVGAVIAKGKAARRIEDAKRILNNCKYNGYCTLVA